MSSWLSLVHGLDLLFTILLVGGVIFSARIHSPCGPAAEEIRTPWVKTQTALLLILLLLSCAWLVLLAHEMTDSWAFDDLQTVVTSSVFGHLWIGKITLLFLLVLISGVFTLRYFYLAVLVLPLFSSLSGHAAAQKSHTDLFIALDYVHFLGASVWIGGLVALIFWLRSRLRHCGTVIPGTTHMLVRRFSHFAIASTGAIGISGVLLAYFYGVRLGGIFRNPYSELVLLKTALFVATLGIASINQFVHLRKWSPASEPKFARGVLRESILELTLIVAVIIVAGFLTRTDLPS